MWSVQFTEPGHARQFRVCDTCGEDVNKPGGLPLRMDEPRPADFCSWTCLQAWRAALQAESTDTKEG